MNEIINKEPVQRVIKEFSNFELIIRIHPAEISGFHPAFVSLENYINNKFKSLPENIKIVSASSRKYDYFYRIYLTNLYATLNFQIKLNQS